MEDHHNLYADFQLSLENCDQEPIHRPRAIGKHGHLITWDHKRKQIIACSEGLSDLLGIASSELWHPNSWEQLPQPLTAFFAPSIDWSGLNPEQITIKGQNFALIGHLVGNHLILEFEPSESKPPRGTLDFKLLNQTLQSLKSCQELTPLFQTAATSIKQITGLDRVMIYRFDEDLHGEVVGEAKQAHLEAFLGLHYPATDIPPIARKLFLTNKSRTIPEVSKDYIPLHFHPKLPAQEYVDLSQSQLRATSPIHIEYLQNMEVKASLTLAIIIEEKL